MILAAKSQVVSTHSEAFVLTPVINAFTADPLTYWAAVLALGCYVFLYLDITRKGMQQNLVTFVLWCLFDAVAAAAAFFEGGNWQLPACYALGCVAIIAGIWRTGTYAIGRFELWFGGMALVCFAGWFFVGNLAAIVISTLALGLATLPQLKDVWLRPAQVPFGPYVGFFAANVMTTFAGTAWTIEERLYPAACVLATFLYLVFALKRHLPREAPT